ncbi:MAG: hypothetical protein P8Y62_10495 [candidate division WOR-3 bacterium]
MKTFLILLLFVSILINSCCKKGKEAVVETKTITKEYATAVTKAPDKAKVLTELVSIRQAINMYKVENGKLPESLSDLPVKIENIKEYEYNHETGKVTNKYYTNL